MKLLIVEDNPKIVSFLKKGLLEEGFLVDICQDGAQAFQQVLDSDYDLILLDILLPGMDGISITQKLRERQINTPILMLTALDQVDDKVKGFNAGADDYLAKPFAFAELLARIRALTRRNNLQKEVTHFTYQDLELDTSTHQASRAGQPLDLTAREFSLLTLFIQKPERLFTRTTILEQVWDMTFDPGTNILDVHVSHLRKKIDDGHDIKLIQTIRGVGYILKAEHELP